MAEPIVLSPSQRMLFINKLRDMPFVSSAEESMDLQSNNIVKLKISYSKFLIFRVWAGFDLLIPDKPANLGFFSLYVRHPFNFFASSEPSYEIYGWRSYIIDTVIPIAFLVLIIAFILVPLNVMFLLWFPLIFIEMLVVFAFRFIFANELDKAMNNALAEAVTGR
jgi:hypothetical protein